MEDSKIFIDKIENDQEYIETQDKLTAKEVKTFLLTCMDFRLIEDVSHIMDNLGYNTNYDHFILAGSSLGIVQEKFPHWGETFFDHLEISLNLHHFKKIVIIDHEDCGAYKKFYPFANKEEEYNNHRDCIQKAYDKITSIFHNFDFIAYFLDLNGNLSEIHIEKKHHSTDRSISNKEKDSIFSGMHTKVKHTNKAHIHHDHIK
jgi:carbonic anhydrase